MKGDQKVIERLNEALFLELGAVNQYWLHYRLLEDWGYTKLAKKERAESIEEMQHADKLVARIIFLEGHPKLFEELLIDEEGHIDFLETQLELLSKLGEEKYGQLNADSADAAE